MKIGILTIHRAINDGSVLQTYCIQQLLQAMLPDCSVEIADYRPKKLEQISFRQTIRRRFPAIKRDIWTKRTSLIRFLKQHCRLSPTHSKTDDIESAKSFIANQHYDAITVGSDTVWQIPNKILRQDHPHIFFLPGISNTIKAAFAPSADILDTTIFNDQDVCEKLRSCIEDFSFISYRDDNSKILLSKTGIAEDRYYYMADPTIMWDFSPLVDSTDLAISPDKPLAGIAVAQDDVKTEATKWFTENEYQVVNLLGDTMTGHIMAPRNFYQSVGVRLGIFQRLHILVTDRFHGSIFALKLAGAPVIFVEPTRKYGEFISKGRDLFRRIGIEDMVWRYDGRSNPKIPIGDYLQTWEKLAVDPQQRLTSLRYSCQNAVDQLKGVLMKGRK